VSGDRFSARAEAALRAAGWHPGRRLDNAALAAIRRSLDAHDGPFGGRPSDYDAAVNRALAEFAGLVVVPEPAGEQLATRPFTLDPVRAAAGGGMEAIIDAGRLIETGLSPLGVEGSGEALLAMNYLGEVIGIDATGEWFLGPTMDAALETLINGRRPERIGDDGRWPGRVWDTDLDTQEQAGLGGLKRPIGAAFYLPYSDANLHYRWLPETLRRIGTVPVVDPVSSGEQFQVEWGGLLCLAYVLDLDTLTVLVLAFEKNAYLTQMCDAEEAGVAWQDLPVVRSLRDTCASLAPDLLAAVVCGSRPRDLLERFADEELDVLFGEGVSLLRSGYPLVYLSEILSSMVHEVVGGAFRDELPVGGGRIIFEPTDGWP
jgi:hypothetical protein